MFPHRSKAQAAKEMGKQALKGDWEAAKDIAKEGMGNAKTAIKQMRAEWVEGVDERVKSEHQRLVALHGTTNELVACLVHQNERSQKEHRRLLNLTNVLQRLPRPSRGDSQVAVSERRSEAIGGAYIELAASIDALIAPAKAAFAQLFTEAAAICATPLPLRGPPLLPPSPSTPWRRPRRQRVPRDRDGES